MKTSTKVKTEKPEASALAERRGIGVKSQRPSQTPLAHGQTKWGLHNILVPTDFSDSSKKALSYAVSVAEQTGGKIILLHVIDPTPVYPDIEYPSEVWSSQAKKAFRKLCQEEQVDPSLLRNTLIREGTPHQEITEAARELGADLIIIATNGRTGLAHVLLGSTTERVVRHAPCPVLVVREKEREFLRG